MQRTQLCPTGPHYICSTRRHCCNTAAVHNAVNIICLIITCSIIRLSVCLSHAPGSQQPWASCSHIQSSSAVGAVSSVCLSVCHTLLAHNNPGQLVHISNHHLLLVLYHPSVCLSVTRFWVTTTLGKLFTYPIIICCWCCIIRLSVCLSQVPRCLCGPAAAFVSLGQCSVSVCLSVHPSVCVSCLLQVPRYLSVCLLQVPRCLSCLLKSLDVHFMLG